MAPSESGAPVSQLIDGPKILGQVTQLAALGARFDAVYACPHHPEGCGAYRHPDHPARKPKAGMILRAAANLELDLKHSWLVGDKTIDIEAARRAELAGAMQVMTGYGAGEWSRSAVLATATFAVLRGATVADAAKLPVFRDRHAAGADHAQILP